MIIDHVWIVHQMDDLILNRCVDRLTSHSGLSYPSGLSCPQKKHPVPSYFFVNNAAFSAKFIGRILCQEVNVLTTIYCAVQNDTARVLSQHANVNKQNTMWGSQCACQTLDLVSSLRLWLYQHQPWKTLPQVGDQTPRPLEGAISGNNKHRCI